jgi:hypothetical protein
MRTFVKAEGSVVCRINHQQFCGIVTAVARAVPNLARDPRGGVYADQKAYHRSACFGGQAVLRLCVYKAGNLFEVWTRGAARHLPERMSGCISVVDIKA